MFLAVLTGGVEIFLWVLAHWFSHARVTNLARFDDFRSRFWFLKASRPPWGPYILARGTLECVLVLFCFVGGGLVLVLGRPGFLFHLQVIWGHSEVIWGRYVHFLRAGWCFRVRCPSISDCCNNYIRPDIMLPSLVLWCLIVVMLQGLLFDSLGNHIVMFISCYIVLDMIL